MLRFSDRDLIDQEFALSEQKMIQLRTLKEREKAVAEEASLPTQLPPPPRPAAPEPSAPKSDLSNAGEEPRERRLDQERGRNNYTSSSSYLRHPRRLVAHGIGHATRVVIGRRLLCETRQTLRLYYRA